MKPDRMARVNRLLRTELAELVPAQVKDPRVQASGMLSVVEVQTSPDLRHAKVYMSILGEPEGQQQALEGLRQARKFLRAELGRRVRLRYTPELTFLLDTSLETASRIEGILRELEKERAQIPGGADGVAGSEAADEDEGAREADGAEEPAEEVGGGGGG